MHTDSDQLREPSTESLAAGYEVSAISVRGLVYFVIGLIVIAALVHLGIWYLLVGYEQLYGRSVAPTSALIDQNTRLPLPPPPRLQPTRGSSDNVPAADLQQMYQQEDEMFTRMGWRVNPQTHVPIEIPRGAIDEVIRQHPRQASGSAHSPSPGTPGERWVGGYVERDSQARADTRAANPHPAPLPEYRERARASANPDSGD